jgi:hypothetical protein
VPGEHQNVSAAQAIGSGDQKNPATNVGARAVAVERKTIRPTLLA